MKHKHKLEFITAVRIYGTGYKKTAHGAAKVMVYNKRYNIKRWAAERALIDGSPEFEYGDPYFENLLQEISDKYDRLEKNALRHYKRFFKSKGMK